MTHRVLVDRSVPTPMRDGTRLMADIYRPAVDRSLPAIVVRLPYGKSTLAMQLIQVEPLRAVEAGYAVVYQDTRGRYESDGEFYPFVHEAEDGYDTVEWVASQPWCDGAVGLAGASYVGISQWLTAALQPPHLRAMFPIVSPSSAYEGMIYQGGAFQLGFTMLWTLLFLAPDVARRRALKGLAHPDVAERLVLATDHIDRLYNFTPLADVPILRESGSAGFYFDWIAHEAPDGYWEAIDPSRSYDAVRVPAFNVGGWYDLFLLGTLENYTCMRREGGTELAREGQRLLIGPWAHGLYGGVYPERSYGVRASSDAVDLTDAQVRFFDRHLKGAGENPKNEARVRIFVMGEDHWRDEDEWPLGRARPERWYLHAGNGGANVGGGLSTKPPAEEAPDTYCYDPRDASPTAGGPSFLPGLGVGANCGPVDQARAEARPDVLTYTSEPLNCPMEVTGPLELVLYAATDCPDTDFVGRLCDVDPGGVSRILAEGIMRARYRNGYSDPAPVRPFRAYAFRINLVATSNVFKPGHRLRIDITSSSSPRFARNPNTGHALGVGGTEEARAAHQTIFHDAERPSHIVLPVVPR